MVTCKITQVERDPWTKEWSKDINPVEPDGYTINKLPSGNIALVSVGPAYAGWLAKNVQNLCYGLTSVVFKYMLKIDASGLLCSQANEADFKITDKDGWTYDGSGNWIVTPAGWEFNINNPWVPTGFVITPPLENDPLYVEANCTLDYTLKTLHWNSIFAENKSYLIPQEIATIKAQQVGWQPGTVVTQLQQGLNGNYGGYTSEYFGIEYDFDNNTV